MSFVVYKSDEVIYEGQTLPKNIEGIPDIQMSSIRATFEQLELVVPKEVTSLSLTVGIMSDGAFRTFTFLVIRERK